MTTSATTRSLPRSRDVLDEFGIYVHVPFCVHRCWYCDFNAYAGLDHLADAYMDALVRDVRTAASAPADADLEDRPTVTSVFVGGGTPSLVKAGHIARVLEAIKAEWTVSCDAEITIECNPESSSPAKLESYLAAGVNRISFGVQSLDDGLLASLGRTHDSSAALAALRAARRAGFTNVSADLIFGIPGEDDAAWRRSVEGVLAEGPSHLSCYSLIYEEGTPLEAWKRLGKVVAVPDDEVAARWETVEALLGAGGFERYEISNWARPGYASRHNRLYWACGEYLGVGAGAHSHLATAGGVRRSWTLRSPERYMREVTGGRCPSAGSEEIDASTRASEVVILGLRRTEGVSAEAFRRLVGTPMAEVFGEEIARGVARDLLSWDGEVLRLRSPLLANEALVEFA